MKYVVGFAFTNDKRKLVLIRKSKPDWQAGFLNGVGGKIEPDENPLSAIIREFKEESGVTTTSREWRLFATGYQRSDHDKRYDGQATVFFFKAFNDFIYHHAETVEEETINKILVSQLRDYNVIENLKWLIPLALMKENTYAEFNF